MRPSGVHRFGMNLQEASDVPRIGHSGSGTGVIELESGFDYLNCTIVDEKRSSGCYTRLWPEYDYRIVLDGIATPRDNVAVQQLCHQLNKTRTVYPGTDGFGASVRFGDMSFYAGSGVLKLKGYMLSGRFFVCAAPNQSSHSRPADSSR